MNVNGEAGMVVLLCLSEKSEENLKTLRTTDWLAKNWSHSLLYTNTGYDVEGRGYDLLWGSILAHSWQGLGWHKNFCSYKCLLGHESKEEYCVSEKDTSW
jgi:hypothetical protein